MEKRADGSIAIPREELYALVWETPLSKIAPTMGTKPTHVAWACDKHKVPRPKNGHWSKLRSGNKPPQPPLPDVEDKDLETVVVYPSGFSLPVAASEANRPAEVSITVPDVLTDPHSLVKKTAAALRKVKSGVGPTVGAYPRDGALYVSVSPEALDRGMRILDTLLKAIEERGWRVEVREESHRASSFITVEGEEIPMRLDEEVKREERPPTASEARDAKRVPGLYGGPYYREVPTGQLALTFDLHIRDGIRRRWADGKYQRLEELLPKILVALSRYAALAREERQRREEMHRRWDDEKRQREEKEARLRLEQARLQSLLDDIDKWRRAEDIRAYVSDVRRRVRQARGPKGTANIQEWVDWALAHADRMDPMVEHEPTMLDE